MRVARLSRRTPAGLNGWDPGSLRRGGLVEKATSAGVPTWIPDHSGMLKEHLFPIVLSH